MCQQREIDLQDPTFAIKLCRLICGDLGEIMVLKTCLDEKVYAITNEDPEGVPTWAICGSMEAVSNDELVRAKWIVDEDDVRTRPIGQLVDVIKQRRLGASRDIRTTITSATRKNA